MPEHELTDAFCQETYRNTLLMLEAAYGDFNFQTLFALVYPTEYCALRALRQFLITKDIDNAESKDRGALRALRGILLLQEFALRIPVEAIDLHHALNDIDAAWGGHGFPEAQEAIAGTMKDFVLQDAQHLVDTVETFANVEPLVVPPTARLFESLEVPGFSLKPYIVFETKILEVWGREVSSGTNDINATTWNPLEIAFAYLDFSSACQMPSQMATAFVNAGMWFYRALQGVDDSVPGANRNQGNSWVTPHMVPDVPGNRMRSGLIYALKRCVKEMIITASHVTRHMTHPAIRPQITRTIFRLFATVVKQYGEKDDVPLLVQLYDDLERARLASPAWRPPAITVSDAVFFEIVSTRLHESYWSRLEVAAADNGAVSVAQLAQVRYEAAVLGHGDLNEARFDAMAIYAKEAKDKLAIVPEIFEHWFENGWWNQRRATVPMLHGKFASDLTAVHAIFGVEIDPDSGDIEVLVQDGLPLVDGDDLRFLLKAAVATDDEYVSPMLVLESLGAFHPFQKAHSRSDNQVFDTLRMGAMFLQQIATQIEVSVTPPFPLRTQELANLTHSPVGDPFDHQRIWLECVKVPYTQSVRYGRQRFVFGTPEIKIHDATQVVSEPFSTWPTARLQEALERFQHYEGYEDLRVNEIVDKGELIHMLEEAAHNYPEVDLDNLLPLTTLQKFTRRLTKLYPTELRKFALFRRIEELCKIEALVPIVAQQKKQLDALKVPEESATQAANMRLSRKEKWEKIIVDARIELLKERGIWNLNPGNCWDEETYTFSRCCSRYNPLCWHDANFPYELCCPDALHLGEEPSVVQDFAHELSRLSNRSPPLTLLLPALDTYLKQPTADGALDAVTELLVDEVDDMLVGEQTADFVTQKRARFEANVMNYLAPALPAARDYWVPALSSVNKIFGGVLLAPNLVAEEDVTLPDDLGITTRRFFHPEYTSGRTEASRLVESLLRSKMDDSNADAGSTKASPLNEGSKVRLHRGDVAEEGWIISKNVISMQPGEVRTIIGLDTAYGIKYLDASEWTQDRAQDWVNHTSRWPGCVEKAKQIAGPGIFVNLGYFGIDTGCFQEDCSHSDHFTTHTAAYCADICSQIRACKFWTTTVSSSVATCWLKHTDAGGRVFDNTHRALSGNRSCRPLSDAPPPTRPALTLFTLLRGETLTHPKTVEVLERFGHMTVDEIRAAPNGALQRIALSLAMKRI